MQKEDLEKLSDDRINREIMDLIYGVGDSDIERARKRGRFNYCNNWSDMGPLIAGCNITLIDPTSLGCEEWQAGKFYTDFAPDIQVQDKKPLRAAAIVYLLMQEN